MPFAFHWYELLPLLLLGLLFLGPKRLPQMGSAVGQTIKEFQKSMREIKSPPADETRALPAAKTEEAE